MVYMHDTPHRELFGRNARFESSGCIRVDQVKTVINWILRGQAGYSEDQYDQIIASQQPYELKVENPPSVRFMYLTAWATARGCGEFPARYLRSRRHRLRASASRSRKVSDEIAGQPG